MKRGMPSGAQTPDGIIFLLALIFSKAPPRYPPHHGAHWAYTRLPLFYKPEYAYFHVQFYMIASAKMFSGERVILWRYFSELPITSAFCVALDEKNTYLNYTFSLQSGHRFRFVITKRSRAVITPSIVSCCI